MKEIVIPIFNEAAVLNELCDSIDKTIGQDESYTVRFIDDGNDEETPRILSGKQHAVLVRRKGKRGYGSAIFDGLVLASKSNPVYIITIDGDMQQDPRYITSLIRAQQDGNLDYVVANKWHGVVGFSIIRIIASRIAGMLTHTLLRIKIHDVTSGFRLYTKPAYDRLTSKQKYPNDYSFNVWSLYQLKQLKGGSVEYVFKPRLHGKSKFSLHESYKYIKTLFTLLFRRGET